MEQLSSSSPSPSQVQANRESLLELLSQDLYGFDMKQWSRHSRLPDGTLRVYPSCALAHWSRTRDGAKVGLVWEETGTIGFGLGDLRSKPEFVGTILGIPPAWAYDIFFVGRARGVWTRVFMADGEPYPADLNTNAPALAKLLSKAFAAYDKAKEDQANV